MVKRKRPPIQRSHLCKVHLASHPEHLPFVAGAFLFAKKTGDTMLKSCKYCGRIHSRTFDCGKKPKIKNKNTINDRFRRSTVWTEKSLLIRRRDRFLCQCCLRNMPGTVRRIEYDGIEVHHIEPLSEAWDRRLDDDNLISLCRSHHEMAEAGEISKEVLHAMAIGLELDTVGYPPGSCTKI